MRRAIWYHSHNLKNLRNSHGVVLLLVKLQAEVSHIIVCEEFTGTC